jgi:hypothetical protein
MKLASLMLLSVCAYAADLMSGGASSHGVWVNYVARLEPGSPPIHKVGGGVLTTKEIIKRHLCNFDNNTYFGYDLTIEPLADNRYRLVFAPSSLTPQNITGFFKEVPVWTSLPLPEGPTTVEVRAGETVALDLFTNPSTGQKVTDYLTIGSGERQETHVTGEARDFNPEDATIEIISPHVSVDGKPLISSQGGISGSAVVVDIPGNGRFIFSLAARFDLGMQKAGEIRGTTMTWHSDGHEYAISSSKPITSGNRAYNLYVFHTPHAGEALGMAAYRHMEDALRNR